MADGRLRGRPASRWSRSASCRRPTVVRTRSSEAGGSVDSADRARDGELRRRPTSGRRLGRRARRGAPMRPPAAHGGPAPMGRAVGGTRPRAPAAELPRESTGSSSTTRIAVTERAGRRGTRTASCATRSRRAVASACATPWSASRRSGTDPSQVALVRRPRLSSVDNVDVARRRRLALVLALGRHGRGELRLQGLGRPRRCRSCRALAAATVVGAVTPAGRLARRRLSRRRRRPSGELERSGPRAARTTAARRSPSRPGSP